MTLYQFRRLNEKEQLDAVERTGVQIGEREDAFCSVRLYQLEYFYVELYHHNHFNVVVSVKSFSNPDNLEPYFESIDIDSLLYI